MRARLLVLLLLSPTFEKNPSLKNTTKEKIEKHSDHFLVKWKAWQALSIMGCVGTLSNTLLIYTFYSVPNMATSVNAMIFMESVYELVYTTIMYWRTYNMVQDKTLFSDWITREQVEFIFASEKSRFNWHGVVYQISKISQIYVDPKPIGTILGLAGAKRTTRVNSTQTTLIDVILGHLRPPFLKPPFDL